MPSCSPGLLGTPYREAEKGGAMGELMKDRREKQVQYLKLQAASYERKGLRRITHFGTFFFRRGLEGKAGKC